MRQLNGIQRGQVTLIDRSGSYVFGRRETNDLSATIRVYDRRFYRDLVLRGNLGAAEAYLHGYWDAPDLTTAMRLMVRNASVLSGFERGFSQLLKPLRAMANRLRVNSRSGSRRNIAAHYDLSNEFFALMLDSTMTYSSGIFPHDEATLQEASVEKYDRLCRQLRVSSQDHLLEIGTGWGGFAEHAASKYGCRVTTTTISQSQFDYAAARFRAAGLEDKITLLKQDYRDLSGKFDKLVSIEMIEAVGERYLQTFFSKCCELLKPQGVMALQAITIPDYRYDEYRGSVDYIQRYIFPGGFLPSISAISDCIRRATDFSLAHYVDFGTHYAKTLHHWRENLENKLSTVEQLGFDQRFLRTWNYYLCYCEAGFLERKIGVAQCVFNRSECRESPLLD